MIRLVAVVVLVMISGLLHAASGQQQAKPTPAETEPKAKATPAGDFAIGQVEAVRPGTPTTLVLRVVEASDSVRRIKVEGRLTVELPASVLRGIQGGAAAIRVGDHVRVAGIVRDGRLIVTSAMVLRGK
ncbi:MAG: hypothetical protein QN168_04340 [Armatimonadota bacterium]|nr:hypothetical protein [Armatimonadota bacterium]